MNYIKFGNGKLDGYLKNVSSIHNSKITLKLIKNLSVRNVMYDFNVLIKVVEETMK